MARVFIVEDNENLREAVVSYLELEDYKVTEFGTLGGVLERIKKTPPDLIILDVMLPDGDGFQFARRLRKETEVPILFLTARDSESDRITGFEIGGDDYVVKPFSPKELILRVKALLKRTMKAEPEANTESAKREYNLNETHLIIDTKAHAVGIDGKDVTLTAAEWNILLYISNTPGIVLSREQLLEVCLDSIAEGSERTIDTHIKNIRAKLGNSGWIETVRGFGYRFTGLSV